MRFQQRIRGLGTHGRDTGGKCGQFPCRYQSCSPLTLYCIHLTAQLDNLSNNQSVW